LISNYSLLISLDPRLNGGAVNIAATTTDKDSFDLKLTSTTVIKARVLANNNAWSPLNSVTINVNLSAGCVLCGSLIISEFSYHPKRIPGANSPESSFVELRNVGKAPIVLTGMRERLFSSFSIHFLLSSIFRLF
jgi:hypothetical protein